jgi:pSer/pThr/pTyr-binding forkhead associated (FHA) protein
VLSDVDARLKTVAGGLLSAQVIPVPQGKLVIGREEDCQVRLESEFVSRYHCVLLLDDFTLRIRDLGSKNGTFVNGHRIGAAQILLHGDMVSIGETTFQVELIQATIETESAVSPSALETTGLFNTATVMANKPVVVAPPPSAPPPDSTPIIPTVISTPADEDRQTP